MKLKEEEILCAAIWFKDFDTPRHTCTNIDKGVVLCGLRHGHIIGQMKSLTGLRTVTNAPDGCGEYVQGFLTSKGRFLDREEAHNMFTEQGHEAEFSDELYSEDLY